MMLGSTVLGTIAGVFGVGMLYYGISGIVWLVSDWKRTDGGDVFGVAICNVIGAMSAFFAVRWIRSALRSSDPRLRR